MYPSRGGINSMNDSKAEKERRWWWWWGALEREHLFEGTIFLLRERECYLTVAEEKNSDSPVRGLRLGRHSNAVISGACI